MWMQTYNGHKFDYTSESPRVVLLDAVHHLSYIPRFLGAAGPYYVLQHMCLVHDLCSPEDKLAGLLHDIHEAYTGDFPSPLKMAFREIDTAERIVCGRVRRALGLPLADSPGVRFADLQALRIERDKFMATPPEPWVEAIEQVQVPNMDWTRWDPTRCRQAFWSRYRKLNGGAS